ncbi:MAG: polysaccharide deacetylase family protein [Spirochaetes bacterium]|nr:polysaccharide deacetylase family protein [Spirochaetota bacterium]
MRTKVAILFGVMIFTSIFVYWVVCGSNQKIYFQKALLTFRFDDCYASQRFAFTVLDKNQMKASIYCITGFVGAVGYLNWNELQTISKRGFEIGSHTHTHSLYHLLLKDHFENEMQKSLETLKKHNIIATSFAWPYGFSMLGSEMIVKRYFDSAQGYPWIGRFRLNGKNANKFSLIASVPSNAEEFETFLNIAIKKRAWLIVCFHKIGEKNERFTISYNDFMRIVEIALKMKRKGLIDIVTSSEGIQRLDQCDSR